MTDAFAVSCEVSERRQLRLLVAAPARLGSRTVAIWPPELRRNPTLMRRPRRSFHAISGEMW